MLLRYLHAEWLPAWAMACGLIAGVVVRRAVAPSYGGFFYFAARWREALTLLAVAISAGLGAAGVIYSHTRLQREVEQRERLEEDIRLARGIQESLLSDEFPSIPWFD